MKIAKIDIIIIFSLFFIFQTLLLNNYLLANDLDYIFKDTISQLWSIPFTWREFFVSDGLGQFTAFTLWSWPYTLLYGLLGKYGIDFSSLVKLLGIIPAIFLGFFGMKKLCFLYEIKDWARAAATLLYLTNTYILLLIDGGQIGLVLAYGLTPLVFAYYKEYIQAAYPKSSFKLIGLIILLSYFDIRICYLILLLIFFDGIKSLVFEKQLGKIRNYFYLAILTSFFLIGAHLFWIWPSIFSKSPQLPTTYDRLDQVNTLSFANISHGFYLLQPHWPKNIFGKIDPVKPEFVLIPILVFIAPLVKKKDRNVAFWLVISLASILLIKGTNEPFSQIYPWLFTHVPGFSFFRDPTKFFFLLALSYSILIGFSVQEILEKLKKYPLIRQLFLVTVLLYPVVLTRPVFTNQTTGLFSRPQNISEYLSLVDYIRNERNFSRILWIPKKPSLGYSSPLHPSLNAIDLSEKRPFSTGIVGTYEKLNFLREATYSGQLLGLAGVSHIIYPYLDSRRDSVKADNIAYYYRFLNQISAQSWANGRNKLVSIPTIDIKEHQDRFFIAPNIWWIIGSDNLYKKIIEYPSLKLSENALIFSEQYPDLGEKLAELKGVKIILNGKNLLDLSASFIPPSNLIFPVKNLDFKPNKTGWWKREALDFISFRDFLQNKYGLDNQDFDLSGGWAVAEGERKLSILDNKLKKNKVLLARVMESSRGGEIAFSQDNKIIGTIITRNGFTKDSNVRWFEVGTLVSDTTLNILTKGDLNIVNALAIVEEEEWNDYKNRGEDFQRRGIIANFDEGGLHNFASVQHKRINSTKYQVTVKDLTHPGMLVFSENFDNLWELDGRSSLPLYSFLNGFVIEKDGDYIVEFVPQSYVPMGLTISFITTLLLIIIIIVSQKSRS